MKQYIGSQQHWEDSINAYYDERERRDAEIKDNREQYDDRVQCPSTMGTCELGCNGSLLNCILLNNKPA